MFQYEAIVESVVDGDTLKLKVDLGFYVHYRCIVRLAGIDTPETVNYTATGISDPAKEYILRNCPPGSVCVVEITRTEKYGRWLASIFYQPGVTDRMQILKGPRCLNAELVKMGLAKAYSGGRK